MKLAFKIKKETNVKNVTVIKKILNDGFGVKKPNFSKIEVLRNLL